jgi:predicted lipoprotein with Yx(FWY)xxD motif
MRSLVAAVALASLLLSACGGDGEATGDTAAEAASPAASPTPPQMTSPAPAAEATSPPAVQAAPGTVIKTAGSQFGEMLFDESGQAIYLFDKEKTPTPECYDECAVAWPPVLTQGPPVSGAGTQADKLGTSVRTDGTTQVTYGGHPLYYYAHEGKNEVKCHNVNGFGGLWLVVTPAGDAAPHSAQRN